MVRITDLTTSVRVEGDEIARTFSNDGILTIPKNSTIIILEEASESITFKSASNLDIWFTALLGRLYVGNVLLTRENAVERLNLVFNSIPKGEGGGMSDECCETINDKLDNLDLSLTDEQVKRIADEVSKNIGQVIIDTSELNDKINDLVCTIGSVSCALDTINGEEIGTYLPISACGLVDDINGTEDITK